MFHLHESLAPHRGLVGAAVLAIAGGLLYWLAFARSGLAIHPSELLRFSTDGSHETAPAAVTPQAAPSLPATSEEPAHAAGWTAPPRVANVEPVASEFSAESPRADEAPVLEPPLAPAVEAPVPLPPVLDDLPTTTMLERSVAPTPQATWLTTPYPSYAFGAGPAEAAGTIHSVGATPNFNPAEQAIRFQPAMNPPR
jgi:hypothetical protein